jgi:beta-glucanase (GH16 family)
MPRSLEVPGSNRPRRRSPRHATTGALCVAVVAAGLLVGGQPASANGHRVTVRRSATAHVHARLTRSATATQTVTVGGYTASASAHGTGTARATGVGTATARPHAATRRAAAHLAAAKARTAARRKALVRARQIAARRALALATARATSAARTQATIAATRLANQPTSSSSTPGQLTGGNPPATITIGSTNSTTSSPPVSIGLSGDSGALGVSAGLDLGGAGLVVSAGIGPCGGAAPAKPGGGTWTCSFDDEFDGTAVDTAKWTVQQTANSGFDQAGACYLDDPANVSESGGLLHLTVRRVAPFTCPSPQGDFTTSYTGGEVTTWNTFSQTYGRFEVRAQLPATTAKGLQETFWLWPVDDLKYGAWPSSGEIDFAEFYSQYAGWVIPYIHYYYDKSTVSWATNTNIVTALPAPYNQPGMNCRIDQGGFDTYTVTWLPNQITIQVNGQDCIVDNYHASNLSGAAPFDQPFFLALTQALGMTPNAPDASTPLPATTNVDYVRVWK